MKNKIGVLILLLAMLMAFTSSGFAAEKFEVTMYVGEIIDLDSFLIDNQVLTAEEDMSWTSGNERILDINSNGTVEAKEEGKATVYARDKNNSSKVATIKIKVVSMVDEFNLINDEVSIQIGEVYKLLYEITPIDGQDSVYQDEIEWTSSNSHYVEVDDNGQLLGIKEGSVKIHAKTVDGGKKDYIVVTVSGLKEDIVIGGGIDEIQVYVGARHEFKAFSEGKDVTLGVEWSSTLDDVLKIDDDGQAEGLKAGRTQVKAATKDKKKFDTVMVKVVSMVKDLTLSNKKVDLKNIGDTVDLEYTLIPVFQDMPPFENDVKWKSSNSSIARVDSEGVVTAKGKGVALITATSLDGEIEAHCSITVLIGDEEKEIIVQALSLDNPVEQLFVGQKYRLPIVIEPADATEIELKFSTELGSSSQVDEEDDLYYFTPKQAGKNKITIKSESEEEIVYKVEIISPIKDIKINVEELQEEKDVYYFYVGQKMLLNSVFEMKKNYSKDDIYESDVTWSVENGDYLDIDKEKREKVNKEDETEYDYYLVGEKKGTTKLKVKSKDGAYEDEIEIKVLTSYNKLELIDQVTLPINTELVPDVRIMMKSDIKYTLIPGVNFDLEKEMRIEHQYVRLSVIEEEIFMEKEIILDLQKSAINSNNSAVIYTEINEHKSRLATLALVRKTAKDGFCEIKESIELEDVFGEAYIVADLDDGIITGKRDGKIELSVTFPGTKVVAKGIYYFSSELKGIIVVNGSGEIVSVNESGFSKSLTDAALKEQMELAIRIEVRYGNRKNEDTPSPHYIEGILNLEALKITSPSLNEDYKKVVTRLELAESFIALIEYIGEEELKKPSGDKFKDTTSQSAELAYDLGLIDLLLPREFNPYGEITPITFSKAIDRMMIVITAYGYDQDRLKIENDFGKGQKLFIDLEDVSDHNKHYIEKYAIEYGIIEGKGNKLSPDKGLTREEFLYYISKLVF